MGKNDNRKSLKMRQRKAQAKLKARKQRTAEAVRQERATR